MTGTSDDPLLSYQYIYYYVEPGVYCREVYCGSECIENLTENGYVLAVYDKSFSNCYKEICNLVSKNDQINGEEIANAARADEDETSSIQAEPQPESSSNPESDNSEDETDDESATTGEQVGTTSLFRDRYGPACPEMEGTFPYEWEVHLVENSETGEFIGSIKFHNCSGGGRVLYTITGTKNDNDLVQLQGTKKTGGGALHEDSADNRTFIFDLSSGTIIE